MRISLKDKAKAIFFAFAVAAGISAIASCTTSPKMDAAIKRDAEAAGQLKEAAKTPGKAVPDDVIRVKNDIWLGDTSDIEFEGEPLPAYLETPDGITLISNRPITLFEVGDMINKTTSLKVRYGQVLEEDVLKNAEGGKPSADVLGDEEWVSPKKMSLAYKGPLSGLLDELSSRFGVWWKYEKKEIQLYRYITKTFVLYSLPSKSTLNVQIGGKGEGGSSSTLNLTSSSEFDLWSNVKESITSMVDPKSKLTIDQANGVISLTATPDDIKKVAKYVNEQNARLARQVAVSVKVMQVNMTNADNYGFNFTAAFNDGTTNAGLTSLAGLSSTNSPANMFMKVMPGNWNFDATVQALSRQGDVSLVTSGTVTTLNNKPAPIQVVRKQSYISEITKTNSGGTGNYYDVSTETKEIETGFTMDVLPRILEHGRLMLNFNLTLSDLVSLEDIQIDNNGSFIQIPTIESRGFTQEVAMMSGESLVLTGYEKTSTETAKAGVGKPSNSLLGGSSTASREKNVLVIVLTPLVMESPLMPESRMRGN